MRGLIDDSAGVVSSQFEESARRAADAVAAEAIAAQERLEAVARAQAPAFGRRGGGDFVNDDLVGGGDANAAHALVAEAQRVNDDFARRAHRRAGPDRGRSRR